MGIWSGAKVGRWLLSGWVPWAGGRLGEREEHVQAGTEHEAGLRVGRREGDRWGRSNTRAGKGERVGGQASRRSGRMEAQMGRQLGG